MNNKQYTTHLSTYNEAEALEQLLKAAASAVEKVSKAFDENRNSDADVDFTITIDGVQTAFICGGPQIEALYSFIKHVASENWYEVDFHERTVKG